MGRARQRQGRSRPHLHRGPRVRHPVRHGRVCGSPAPPRPHHRCRHELGLSPPQREPQEGSALEPTPVDRCRLHWRGRFPRGPVRQGSYRVADRTADGCWGLYSLGRRPRSQRPQGPQALGGSPRLAGGVRTAFLAAYRGPHGRPRGLQSADSADASTEGGIRGTAQGLRGSGGFYGRRDSRRARTDH